MADKRKKSEFNQFKETFRDSLGEDLAGLIGSEIKVDSPEEKVVERSALFSGRKALAHTRCSARDESGSHLHVVVPSADAVVLGALLMEIGIEAIEDRKSGGLDEEMLDAFGEIMNVANGVLSRALESAGLPALQSDGTSELKNPSRDTEHLPEGIYRLLRHRLTFPDGYGEGQFDLILPIESDTAWFGGDPEEIARAAGSNGDEAAQEAHSGEVDGTEKDDEKEIGPIVVVESDDGDRANAEDLEDALGVSVWTFESREFGLELLEEISEASAVIVSWNLGGQSGLDVMETLLWDERTQNIPVFLASAEPTERMVVAALRAGARSFLMKPFEVEEVKRRLSPWISFEPSP